MIGQKRKKRQVHSIQFRLFEVSTVFNHVVGTLLCVLIHHKEKYTLHWYIILMLCVYKALCHVACQLCITNIRTYKSSQMAHPIVTKHGTPPKRVYVYITG